MQHQFQTTIRAAERGGAYVLIPEEIDAALGSRGRIPVKATFDGTPYRGSIVTMRGRRMLGVLKAIREALGKVPGDAVTVTVELDLEERTVDVPPELATALQNEPAAREFFDRLSYTCRREYAQWIAGAKRDDTRARRAAKAIVMLREGRKL